MRRAIGGIVALVLVGAATLGLGYLLGRRGASQSLPVFIRSAGFGKSRRHPRCILRHVRYVTGVLALLLLTACPRVPDPERTTVDGREVLMIQEAHCGIGDCARSFYINRIEYFPTCGRLPDALRREISGGTLFAVADPDASYLPERRATVVPSVEPRWLVGVRILGATPCGTRPRWSVAWPVGAEVETAICSSRPDIGKVLHFGCE